MGQSNTKSQPSGSAPAQIATSDASPVSSSTPQANNITNNASTIPQTAANEQFQSVAPPRKRKPMGMGTYYDERQQSHVLQQSPTQLYSEVEAGSKIADILACAAWKFPFSCYYTCLSTIPGTFYFVYYTTRQQAFLSRTLGWWLLIPIGLTYDTTRIMNDCAVQLQHQPSRATQRHQQLAQMIPSKELELQRQLQWWSRFDDKHNDNTNNKNMTNLNSVNNTDIKRVSGLDMYKALSVSRAESLKTTEQLIQQLQLYDVRHPDDSANQQTKK